MTTHPRVILRVEGLAVFVAALAVYFRWLNGPLWMLVLLALAPDLSMVGYLAGPRVGAIVYNVIHNYLPPLVVASVGWWFGFDLVLLAAVVWIGHIGADRAAGYGLKLPTGFGDTHLASVTDIKEA